METINNHEPLPNGERSHALATTLFPLEKWIAVETNIWVAKSRLIQKKREPEKWEREMSQIRILTSRGSAAYFLPELEIKGETGKRCADLVLDGEIMEIKTVSGSRATLGGEFRLAYKQGASLMDEKAGIQEHSVFVRLKTDLDLHSWTYEELRAIIGKK